MNKIHHHRYSFYNTDTGGTLIRSLLDLSRGIKPYFEWHFDIFERFQRREWFNPLTSDS